MDMDWTPTGARACYQELQPQAQHPLERQEEPLLSHPQPHSACSSMAPAAAEAGLSPGASSAALSVGMGLPKIQTAEITRSSTLPTSEMNLTESNGATSHQLKTLK